ncbi:FAD-dependent oxidoreductase [Nocardioides sp.]|uniref:FAD-dependent oxidoreductase n=1 Tax=Nocardioides sp. TaxID=35761 RepID=UPI0035165EFB
MPYVVTQSCCADASCVQACPVNCIHPAPGEPGFGTAEMLYVDAKSCVDCGACATACPVEAIKPHTTLTPAEQPFLALNAAYYDCFPHADRHPLAIIEKQRRLQVPGPFRVAVIGAGPAGLYTADELLKHPEIEGVDVYDRLPTPYGLVRYGVAPDHGHTKQVEQLFRAVEELPGFRYFLGVEVGRDVTLADLREQYHAVVYATGAASDRRLGVPGEQLPGSLSATELVAWYNGHPDRADLPVPLEHERAVVIGNGNVALDVARILTADLTALERTDMSALAWAALQRSSIREVVVLGRRGPADAAFTLPELVGLAALEDVDVVVDADPASLAPGAPGDGAKLELLREIASRTPVEGRRRLVLRFHTSPVAVLGEDAVTGLRVVRDGVEEDLDCGLVLRAIGYRGLPVADLPYDEATGTVPNDAGRVETGLYVAGWVKRGPSGFIGTNKTCAQETVTAILDDLDAGRPGLPAPVGTADTIATVVAERAPEVIDLAGWRRLDAEERRRGAARGRPRAKVVELAEMRRLARAGEATGPGRPGRAGRGGGAAAAVRRYASVREIIRGSDRRR